ncbi:MAG: FAD-binding protein [Devosia sp.]
MDEIIRNWAGNVTFAHQALHTPQSVDEIQSVVRKASKIRVVGSRHSFNDIADTKGDLLSLRHLTGVRRIDPEARTVTIAGGAAYRDFARELDAAGYALANLASLPHITVAGACATSTHGSGSKNPGLASAIASLTLVTANGELVTLSRGDAEFAGAPVNVGALGVVVEITLDIVPRYEARQEVFLDLPFEKLASNFDAIMSSAYSVSVFTSWRGDSVDQVWLKSLGDAPPHSRELHGARWADRNVPLNPPPGTVAPGDLLGGNEAWYNRVSHHRVDTIIGAAAELQTEYFIACNDAPAALEILRAMQHEFAPLLQISEIRTIAADQLWLSGFYQRDSVALHFAWYPQIAAVRALLPRIEAALAPFSPRPHWGKLFTMPAAEVKSRYEKLGDFRKLATRLDPDGKFRNAFVDEFVF